MERKEEVLQPAFRANINSIMKLESKELFRRKEQKNV